MISKKTDIHGFFLEAIQHHQAGRLSQAKNLYEQVLAATPSHANANHLLGVVEHQLGNNERAEQLISNALQIKSDDPSFHVNLSVVLQEQGRVNEAVVQCRKALALAPANYPARINLGNYYRQLGQFDKSAACYQEAITLEPDKAEAYNNLGSIMTDRGRLGEALASCRKALALKPDYAEAHRNVGNILIEKGQVSEAIASYRMALKIKPTLANAANNLGNAFLVQGSVQEAMTTFRQVLKRKPDYALAHSNLLLAMNYSQALTQVDIYKESLEWHEKHAAKLAGDISDYNNSRDSDRCLRIGYVSPDFRDHSVASFIEPVLAKHNREKVEIFCYANVLRPDRITSRIQAVADHWCSIVGMGDAEVVSQVRQDRIDILVDLAGHTAKNRLPVFARRPAPVQVTWLGYPNTTGLRVIDYRLTDSIADPADEGDSLYSEKLIRLEHGFLCYRPDPSAPEVEPLPCMQTGGLTFGSFNNLTKVRPEVVRLWAEILHKVPGSRLLLKSVQLVDPATREKYLALFVKEGIAANRLELLGKLPEKKDHLKLYNRIDISLDSFPYNGTTTTCEALWMGVPVVTLLGDRHCGRVGASILHRIGLGELVASSADEYVGVARVLANDKEQLQGLRSGLRSRLLGSQLLDSGRFTKDLENVYRMMWLQWLHNSG